MSQCWAAVILYKAQQRLGIDLVARAGQITAAIIAAKIVALRRAGAGIDDINS